MTPTFVEQFSDVIEVDARSDLDEIGRFRAAVWAETESLAASAFPNGSWADEHDAVSRHWVIRDGRGELAAAARWTMHASLAEVSEAEEYLRYGLPMSGPVAAPARVVVRRSAQGRGLAMLLLDAQERASQEAEVRYAVRQASPTMVKLLVRRGWQVLGPASVDARFPGVAFMVAIRNYSADGMEVSSCRGIAP